MELLVDAALLQEGGVVSSGALAHQAGNPLTAARAGLQLAMESIGRWVDLAADRRLSLLDDLGQVLEDIDRTEVWFNPLSDEQIDDYLRREDVTDKAGAYAIQGYAGVYIPKIAGNYFNVMGLPLPLVHQLICRTLS